jgi:hypothetical protein
VLLFVLCFALTGGLGQTGTGHFSPIGGFHESKDLVLIMDVARFKVCYMAVGVLQCCCLLLIVVDFL